MATFIEMVAARIAAHGVKHTFGLMGAGTIRLVDHLVRDHGLAYHGSRHESGAISAADAYSRVSGRVGVALVTWGAGFTNTLTALTTAKRASSPLLLIAADASTAPLSRYPFAAGVQSVNQAGLSTALDVPSITVRLSSVRRDMEYAFQLAEQSSTPVCVLLPLENEIETAQPADEEVEARPDFPRLEPPSENVQSALSIINTAKRPLILAGWGAVCSEAERSLVDLADRIGALLATSERGSGLFHAHPFNLGLCGGIAPQPIQNLISQSDCVISFGASLNNFTTSNGELFKGAKIIQCDTRPSAFFQYLKPASTICGDAKITAEKLLAGSLSNADGHLHRKGIEEIGSIQSSLESRHSFSDVSSENGLDPRAVCARLDEIIPIDRIVVTDAGLFALNVVEAMRISAPRCFHWMINFGAIGSGMGAGIGAAIADPGRFTVLFVGDGGFFMSMGDLDMAVRSKVPLLVVCMNNGAYGAELRHMRQWQLPLDHARFATPNLAEIASAMGVRAYRVTDIGQLGDLGGQIRHLDRPMFLDCVITDEQLPGAVSALKH